MKYAGQPGAEHGDPERRQVQARREPVPAEDPEAEERRLEHERGQALDRERRAEDVADELRVHRPVHPELELLHEPGRDPDREVDQEQRPEEARQPQPRLVAGPVPERLHDRDERPQPQRQRHEQEVVDRRRRELDPREVDGRDGEQAHDSIRTRAQRDVVAESEPELRCSGDDAGDPDRGESGDQHADDLVVRGVVAPCPVDPSR